MIYKFLSILMVMLMGLGMTGCSDNGKDVGEIIKKIAESIDDNGDKEVDMKNEKEASTDFEKISLKISGDTAETTVFTVYATDKGVRFEHYLSWGYWDEELEEQAEKREYLFEFDGNDEDYRFFAELFGEAGIKNWDGFSGSDSEVLDGTSFSFNATLADGSEIYAGGSNSFPEGYSILKNALYEFSNEKTTDTGR